MAPTTKTTAITRLIVAKNPKAAYRWQIQPKGALSNRWMNQIGEPHAAKMTPQQSLVRSIAWLLLLSALASFVLAPLAAAQEASPFAKLAGRWLGEGRLGYAGGKIEAVKCRVTYIVSEPQVRQTIRCATEGDTVEVQSIVTHGSGSINGTWKELSRNWSGELSGSVTANGFKVAIRGSELNANMDIIVKDNRQIIEIQFIDSSLIGLTLVLNKG
jgi:hypothetical protein